MIVPIVGLSPSGAPLITQGIAGDEAAEQPVSEIVRRLGLASLIMLLGPKAVLDAPPSEANKSLLLDTQSVVGPFALDNADAARPWLENGAQYALLTSGSDDDVAGAVRKAATSSAIPAERLLLLLDVPALDGSAAVKRFAARLQTLASPSGQGMYECRLPEKVGVVSGVVLVIPAGTSTACEEELLQQLAALGTRDRLQIFLAGLSSASAASVGHLHHMGISSLGLTCLGPCAAAQPRPPPPALIPAAAALVALFALPPYDLGPCVAACVRTDRSDGLFPTLVMEADGAALGLVYSSSQSIAAAMRCGRGVYWSRSRQSLWRKGDTSGAWQTLQRIRLDCDADALCFVVTQHGVPPAFCHKNSLGCWGLPTGLQALQLTLQQRKANAPAGSYTKKLFDDPIMLRHKLVEEAQELAEAETPDHVAAECADVLYFAMVRCVAAGVKLANVLDHLERRTLKLARRPGLAKKERIDAAAAILEKKGGKGGKGGSGAAAGGMSAYARWLPLAVAAGMLAAVSIKLARAK